MIKHRVCISLHGVFLAIVLVSLLISAFPGSIATADTVVNFPDPGLQQAIREAIGKPTGDIYQSDLVGLTTLNAGNRGITDLTGLEWCISLTDLKLGCNSIGDISPLSGLTSLTDLDLRLNHISNISSLSDLTSLTDLTLNWNQIESISSLSSLPNLKSLDLHENWISDILPLYGLTNLTYLNLHYNSIGDISPLSGLTSLTDLYLSFNHISNISPLSGLTSLTSLYLLHNQISDISTLSNLTGLTTLSLNGNQIVNVSSLSGLNNLIWLDLGYNQIGDIEPLVSNLGIAQGDTVFLLSNPLNSDSIGVYIPILESRGVDVHYDIATPVTGITREVNGDILPAVNITIDGIGTVVSDQNGDYEIMVTAAGDYAITAHKDGFRDMTRTISIAGLGQEFAVICNSQGQYGLIPCAPDMWYALDCVNHWLYPPDPDTGLDIWTALDVINAWLYPGCS